MHPVRRSIGIALASLALITAGLALWSHFGDAPFGGGQLLLSVSLLCTTGALLLSVEMKKKD